MHDFSATGFFSGTAPLYGFNDEYERVEISKWSYPASFMTRINALELDGMIHLRPYRVKEGRKSTIIPSVGLSLSMFHYTPYRTTYVQRLEDESYFDYQARVRPGRINLRDLGSEGQNFLPGAEPYSSIAFSGGLNLSLTWLFKNFAIKGEVRSAYTSTDYLDDFGPGLWYGGDRNALLENHQVENAEAVNISSLTGSVDLPRNNTFRSTDGLNDWYFQGHLGFSIFLDSFKKKKVKL